jgi:hypothetical protein
MRKYGLILLALTLCAGAANAQKVKVDWDRMTDFTPYKTYKWTKIPSPRTPTPEMEKLILSMTDTQLGARGMKKIEEGEPDLLVGYSITLEPPKKGTAAPTATDAGPWQTGSSWSEKTSSEQAARKGTLFIDIADAKKNLLVWRGAIFAEVGYSVEDARFRVSKGLGQAFMQFPPPVKR